MLSHPTRKPAGLGAFRWHGLSGLLFLAVLPGLAGGQAPVPVPAAAPLEVYAALPAGHGPRLSPDGRHLALIAPVGGRDALVIQDLDGAARPVVIPTGEGVPNWVNWKSDRRLLLSLRVVSQRGPLLKTVDTRLVAVDADGSHVLELVQSDKADHVPQIQDHLLSLLPGDANHILLQLPKIDRTTRDKPSASTVNARIEHPEVVRVDLTTGLTETVVPSHGLISDWIADSSGQVRLGWQVVPRDKALTLLARDKALTLLARDSAQGSWRPVRQLVLNRGEVFTPIAFIDGQPDRLLVLNNRGNGHDALVEYNLADGSHGRTLAARPDSDVEPIVIGGRLVGYDHDDASDGPVYIDPGWAADARTVRKALPGTEVRVVDRSADGRRALLAVTKGTEPTTHWLLSRGDGAPELEPVIEPYPQLAPAQIARTREVHYKARDGLDIPAYLTLPPGHRRGPDAQPLPFVVLPHGGPSAHDTGRFDHWVQFLASRGYGVLQPQFRGSTGRGQAFLTAGYRQWGLAMQDDVTDGTRWLIDQHLADPARIAIVGASYGGYAALMGVAKEPTLYRCAMAIAPVTDLPMLIDDQQSHSLFGDLNVPQIGSDSRQLDQTSPARLANRITVPVLLLHGRKDYTVPLRHSELMAEALKKAGKPVQTVVLDDASHYFETAADRLAVLKAMEGFLAAQLR